VMIRQSAEHSGQMTDGIANLLLQIPRRLPAFAETVRSVPSLG
jgi:hypothetical protein